MGTASPNFHFTQNISNDISRDTILFSGTAEKGRRVGVSPSGPTVLVGQVCFTVVDKEEKDTDRYWLLEYCGGATCLVFLPLCCFEDLLYSGMTVCCCAILRLGYLLPCYAVSWTFEGYYFVPGYYVILLSERRAVLTVLVFVARCFLIVAICINSTLRHPSGDFNSVWQYLTWNTYERKI